jgi:hypothetical protein
MNPPLSGAVEVEGEIHNFRSGAARARRRPVSLRKWEIRPDIV